MRELWLWIQSVVRQWKELLGGGVIVVLINLASNIGIIKVSTKVTWAVIAGTLITAFFVSWRNQFRLRINLEQKLADPILEADLPREARLQPENENRWSLLTCRLSVRNVGLVPTILWDWELHIPSKNVISSPLDPYDSYMTPGGSPRPLVDRPILDREPIQPGGSQKLSIQFSIPYPVAEVRGLPVEIRFKDVKARIHVISYTFL